MSRCCRAVSLFRNFGQLLKLVIATRRTIGDLLLKAKTFNGEILTKFNRLKSKPHRRHCRRKERVVVEALKEFHDDAIYAGDLHRADMAWAKHVAGCGLTLEQIKGEILIPIGKTAFSRVA
jgi:hypothetical protein